MVKNNVIDMSARLRRKDRLVARPVQEAKIVDLTDRRAEIIESERRQVKRTILSEFVGASVVVPQKGLLKVALYDISATGLSFEMPVNEGAFNNDEELAFRVYLNYETYFPFTVKVRHVAIAEADDCYRIGCEFVKGTINDKALHHFVGFLENVSASLQRDSGDIMVSNLNT